MITVKLVFFFLNTMSVEIIKWYIWIFFQGYLFSHVSIKKNKKKLFASEFFSLKVDSVMVQKVAFGYKSAAMIFFVFSMFYNKSRFV